MDKVSNVTDEEKDNFVKNTKSVGMLKFNKKNMNGGLDFTFKSPKNYLLEESPEAARAERPEDSMTTSKADYGQVTPVSFDGKGIETNRAVNIFKTISKRYHKEFFIKKKN